MILPRGMSMAEFVARCREFNGRFVAVRNEITSQGLLSRTDRLSEESLAGGKISLKAGQDLKLVNDYDFKA